MHNILSLSRQVRKKEYLAKTFFNSIDKDMSGELTEYELRSALEVRACFYTNTHVCMVSTFEFILFQRISEIRAEN
jgi:hypothetical protein